MLIDPQISPTMTSLRQAFIAIVAAMAMTTVLAAAQPDNHGTPGVMSIRNELPNSKLFVQCSSDIGQRPVHIMPPHSTHSFIFYPDATAYWMCTVYSAVPSVWGKFNLYARNPSFRACYNTCVWKANEDGMQLISEGGVANSVLYHWQKRS